MDQKEFDHAIKKFSKRMSPVVQNFGGELNILTYWLDNTANAFVYQSDEKRISRPPYSDTGAGGKFWEIAIYGGLARLEGMTSDAFQLLICHELGHHLGGQPRKIEPLTGELRWITNESQADYFASAKCTHYLWKNDFNRLRLINRPKDDVYRQCATQWQSSREIALCRRTIYAALELTAVMAKLRKLPAPQFGALAQEEAIEIFDDHATPTCRLNTFTAGALCNVSYKIPLSSSNYRDGACLANQVGSRPSCWFPEQLNPSQ